MSDSVPRSIEQFWPALGDDDAVITAMHQELGDGAEMALEALRGGESLVRWNGAVEDLIDCLVRDEAEQTYSIPARGGCGKFSISVMRFGPVYWVTAPEFDAVGYFGTEHGAITCAEREWDTFIEAHREWLERHTPGDEGDDDE